MKRLGPPPTLDEWRAMNLTRPLTQEPIGWATTGRRFTDARLSLLVATKPKDASRRKAAA